ncbi:MAG: hypothetical protein M3176_00190 [Chloroflexota bacterium]|nr:hypothetical protein [Chloroflexota bacterium]
MQDQSHDDRSRHRQMTHARSEEHRRKSFAIEDARWAAKEQLKDWGVLALMMAISVAWSLFVYFLEPGLR